MKPLVVVVALVLGACTSSNSSLPSTRANGTPRPTSQPVPSGHPHAPLSARIVLPSKTIARGSSLAGHVVVVNNTGRELHGSDCGSPFQVALGNDRIVPTVAWSE